MNRTNSCTELFGRARHDFVATTGRGSAITNNPTVTLALASSLIVDTSGAYSVGRAAVRLVSTNSSGALHQAQLGRRVLLSLPSLLYPLSRQTLRNIVTNSVLPLSTTSYFIPCKRIGLLAHPEVSKTFPVRTNTRGRGRSRGSTKYWRPSSRRSWASCHDA